MPEAKAAAGPVALSLSESVRLALKNNLGTVLADEATRMARGQRIVTLSSLLPQVGARVSQASIQSNLAAYGFSGFPGMKTIVGPFSLFDARVGVSQQVLNFKALNASRASAENERASGLDLQDSRDTVVLVVTALYLDAAAGLSRVEAAKARVAASQALYDQAVSFKASGVVPGIDVLRAEVQLRAQRQRLTALQNEFEKAKLRLGRAIGLAGDAAIQLTDPMPSGDASALPKLEQAVGLALDSRMDYRSLQSRLKSAEFARRAATAGHLPSVAFNGDYGSIGKSPDNSHGTFTVAVALNIPLFEGRRTEGELMEADSSIARLRAQLADLRARIEFDVHTAELDLQAAADQLDVARGAVDLARRQEEQARDRFAAGVTNNLEVVQAQEALAVADENLIGSLLASNLAKAALARSIGASEQRIPAFLTGAK